MEEASNMNRWHTETIRFLLCDLYSLMSLFQLNRWFIGQITVICGNEENKFD